jgi:hypothetical protein
MMNKRTQTVIRLLIASGVGLIVFIISWVVVWQNPGIWSPGESIDACVWSGIAAFILSFLTIKPADLNGQGMIALIVRIVLTIIAAVSVSIIISLLHQDLSGGH